MKPLPLILACSCLAIISHAQTYFSNYTSDHEHGCRYQTIVTIKKDSALVEYYYWGQSAVLFQINPTETIPLKTGAYRNIQVLKLSRQRILARITLNNPSLTAEYRIIHLKRTNADETRVRWVKNRYNTIVLDEQQFDTVATIFQLDTMERGDWGTQGDVDFVYRNAGKLPTDEYERQYRVLLHDNLLQLQREKNAKDSVFHLVQHNPSMIDSSMVAWFFKQFEVCHEDKRLFYEIFMQRPDLYPLKYPDIPLWHLRYAIMDGYEDAISKEELRALYCRLRPYKKEYREGDYASLFLIERSIGNSPCPAAH